MGGRLQRLQHSRWGCVAIRRIAQFWRAATELVAGQAPILVLAFLISGSPVQAASADNPPIAVVGDVIGLQARRTVSDTEQNDKRQLINLNPTIGAQYIYQDGKRRWHLQLGAGANAALHDGKLRFRVGAGVARWCDLSPALNNLAKHQRTAPYAAICGGAVLVRQRQNGWKPGIAKHAEMLRSWGTWTESLINGYKDLRSELGLVGDDAEVHKVAPATPRHTNVRGADLRENARQTALGAYNLGLRMDGVEANSVPPGVWHRAQNFEDVWVSVITLQQIQRDIFDTHKDRVHPLSANNGAAQRDHMVYLVAFDLARYTLGWMHGTEHPGVGWSSRSKLPRDNPRGPEGFGKLDPLQPTGAVSPHLVPFVVGTFSGGFQRKHGAFRRGERAKSRKAHHYGFVEDGVVLSTPQPSLATVMVGLDGHTMLREWKIEDAGELARYRYVRQNGVPIIEGGGPDTVGIPGPLVSNWVAGNWSGSVDRQLMTPRAAGCLLEEDGRRLFIYGFFSGHTPSGMARVLQAYRCDYALHLDMNSAGQAYFSLFNRGKDAVEFNVEHLVKSMAMVDGWIGKNRTPRFLLKADYKDFFFIKRR